MKYKIRSMFIPSPGNSFISFDLSQAETWIVAYLANEGRMKDALAFSDIHTITASALFLGGSCPHDKWTKNSDGSRTCSGCNGTITEQERYLGKRSNHGNSYRMSPEQWSRTINADSDKPPYVTVSVAEAKKYHKAWLGFYPGIARWWRQIEYDIGSTRTLTTPYGRKRTFYAQWGDPLFKEATAFVPQSTVADHAYGAEQEGGVSGGILGISKLPDIKRYCKLVQTAHDSILIEAPTKAVSEIANHVYNQFRRPLTINGETFTIPVDGEYGERWGELEPMPKEWLQ